MAPSNNGKWRFSNAGHPQNPTGSHTPEVHIKRENSQNPRLCVWGRPVSQKCGKRDVFVFPEQRMKGIGFFFQQAQGINQNLEKMHWGPDSPEFCGHFGGAVSGDMKCFSWKGQWLRYETPQMRTNGDGVVIGIWGWTRQGKCLETAGFFCKDPCNQNGIYVYMYEIYDKCQDISMDPTGWFSTSYKWGCNPYKWPYKWVFLGL